MLKIDRRVLTQARYGIKKNDAKPKVWEAKQFHRRYIKILEISFLYIVG